MPPPFRLHVPDADIADLRERLARTRWPDRPAGAAWQTGTDLGCCRRWPDARVSACAGQ
ncbi:MAG: epoxide hydrolase N-terminal domain-containing protein [Proteobacteria bacterium]|nr:epoxide hydrolase N-terminal domain-containing protein [Pseudomonadota bacterium]